MFGHRGIWADGWKAVTYHEPDTSWDADDWELYHLDSDFSECHDLAEKHPEKLRELIDLWWAEAGRNGVLPLDDRRAELWRPTNGWSDPRNRRRYVYKPPFEEIRLSTAPSLGNRTILVTAAIEREHAEQEGCLVRLRRPSQRLHALRAQEPPGVRLQPVRPAPEGGCRHGAAGGQAQRRLHHRAARPRRPCERRDRRSAPARASIFPSWFAGTPAATSTSAATTTSASATTIARRSHSRAVSTSLSSRCRRRRRPRRRRPRRRRSRSRWHGSSCGAKCAVIPGPTQGGTRNQR